MGTVVKKMSERQLRKRLIRLAAQRPELRGDLLPLLAGQQGRQAGKFDRMGSPMGAAMRTDDHLDQMVEDLLSLVDAAPQDLSRDIVSVLSHVQSARAAWMRAKPALFAWLKSGYGI